MALTYAASVSIGFTISFLVLSIVVMVILYFDKRSGTCVLSQGVTDVKLQSIFPGQAADLPAWKEGEVYRSKDSVSFPVRIVNQELFRLPAESAGVRQVAVAPGGSGYLILDAVCIQTDPTTWKHYMLIYTDAGDEFRLTGRSGTIQPDGSVTWGFSAPILPPVALPGNATVASTLFPKQIFVIGDDNLIVVFSGETHSRIRHYTNDGGWSASDVFPETNNVSFTYVDLIHDGAGNICIVYANAVDQELYWIHSVDGGTTWNSGPVDNGTTFSLRSFVLAEHPEGHMYLFFHDDNTTKLLTYQSPWNTSNPVFTAGPSTDQDVPVNLLGFATGTILPNNEMLMVFSVNDGSTATMQVQKRDATTLAYIAHADVTLLDVTTKPESLIPTDVFVGEGQVAVSFGMIYPTGVLDYRHAVAGSLYFLKDDVKQWQLDYSQQYYDAILGKYPMMRNRYVYFNDKLLATCSVTGYGALVLDVYGSFVLDMGPDVPFQKVTFKP